MPFIGKQPKVGAYQLIDSITTSATATYALTVSGDAFYPESARNLIVSLNGITQAPESAYTVSGSNIVFDSALTSSDVIDYILVIGDAVDIGTPSDGTVGTAQMNYPLGNFSSTGIDDNSNALAMTISSDEDISIGSASNHAGARVTINDTPPTAFGSPMLQVGQETFTADGYYSIGLGYTAGSYTKPPAEIAAVATSSSGGTTADIVFGTRNATTNTAPTERLRIASNGEARFGNDVVLNNTAYVYSKAGGSGIRSGFLLDGTNQIIKGVTGGSERVRVTANGLTFNGDSAAANALDDYEEGTWTPTITGHGGGSTQTYNTQSGVYRKVGNLVYATCRITLTSKGNMSGNYVLLQGWPFAFGGTTTTAGYGGVNYFTGVGNSVSSIWWELGGGSTISAWLAYVSGSSAGASSYMPVSGINNNFYFHCSAVYYSS